MKRLAGCLLLVLGTLAAGCVSPEASRTRDGGPGADVGNYSPETPRGSQAPRPAYRG